MRKSTNEVLNISSIPQNDITDIMEEDCFDLVEFKISTLNHKDDELTKFEDGKTKKFQFAI